LANAPAADGGDQRVPRRGRQNVVQRGLKADLVSLEVSGAGD